jgi:hypothetical protein
MTKKLKIFLTGGLGNQLFQLAAGLYYLNGRKLELDLETANPRRSSTGEVELLTLNLPEKIELQKKNKGKLARKIFGFNLRSGYSPRKHEQNVLFRSLKTTFSSIVMMLLFGRRLKISVSGNLGNDPEIRTSNTNEILIGYFQTHIVAEEILSIKDSLFKDLYKGEILKYRREAKEEIPLLVHVRLGDYQGEDEFGILDSDYYEKAIEALWAKGIYKKIWLFSDQPEDAIRRIPQKYKEITRVISSEGLESAETLIIMTLCQGHIIANSSFSWWGAFLRENQNSPVIAPQPWFISLGEPSQLVPNQWTRYRGFL